MNPEKGGRRPRIDPFLIQRLIVVRVFALVHRQHLRNGLDCRAVRLLIIAAFAVSRDPLRTRRRPVGLALLRIEMGPILREGLRASQRE
jgi:hypothetical protein